MTQTGGVISPGNSPGILNIDGDLDAAGGSLRVEIAGPPRSTTTKGTPPVSTSTG